MKIAGKLRCFLGGVVFTLILCTVAIPALASNIDVIFNAINISVNGKQIAASGQSYKLDNGKEVPYSILYKDTTYVPIRKAGEIFGKNITWNEASSTAGINDKTYSDGSNVKMYSRFDNVPDFGVFANVGLSHVDVDGNMTAYSYEINKYSPLTSKYKECLIEQGFAYWRDFTSGGYTTQIYRLGSRTVSVGFVADFFVVIISNF